MSGKLKIKAKDVIKRLRGESDRGRFNLYLHKTTLKTFRAACRKLDVSPGKALEHLMIQFIESAKRIK
jgi:hypothetical protein